MQVPLIFQFSGKWLITTPVRSAEKLCTPNNRLDTTVELFHKLFSRKPPET